MNQNVPKELLELCSSSFEYLIIIFFCGFMDTFFLSMEFLEVFKIGEEFVPFPQSLFFFTSFFGSIFRKTLDPSYFPIEIGLECIDLCFFDALNVCKIFPGQSLLFLSCLIKVTDNLSSIFIDS